ncbi:hypothetical protein GEMRC1_000030 [Eukaryota sp. GEM-RC1]
MKLFQTVKHKALRRLQYEGDDKSPRLSDTTDEFYHKPTEFSLHSYIYYECFDCKSPYFGGRRECGVNAGNDDDFDPSKLKCQTCISPNQATSCSIHGTDAIQWKCVFCCEIAAWQCGSQNYCEACHKRSGQVSSLLSSGRLPPCPGSTCLTKVKHPQPGVVFCLGCGLCRESNDY